MIVSNFGLKLAAPWTTLYRELEMLFEKDDEITTFFDEYNVAIKIYVANEKKAQALSNIIPEEKIFGNVNLKIEVIPPNGEVIKSSERRESIFNGSYYNDFVEAFDNNPIVKSINTVGANVFIPFTFIEFVPEVVQFYNDNMANMYGIASVLYEEIARDIFEMVGVFFSTAKVE